MSSTAKSMLTGALAAVVLGGGVVGCGGDDGGTAAGGRPATAGPRGPVPPELRSIESAAEDTIDFALAGRRDSALGTAQALKAAADGPAAEALRDGGVPDSEIAEFRARADQVATLAPHAGLVRVALASNHAFAMVPGFFARYENPVPADVLEFDYLDFEAKLRAKARDGAELRSAAERLGQLWTRLRAGVLRAGGEPVASRFDAHVARLLRLVAAGEPAGAEREAQHGLDLVDEVEGVYG